MDGIAEFVLGMGFWSLVKWGLAVGSVGLGVFVVLPTRYWLSYDKATLDYLADTTLRTLDESKRELKASELWQHNGCVFMVVRRPG